MTSLLYTLLIPMLNSLIYSLQNKDVKEALEKGRGAAAVTHAAHLLFARSGVVYLINVLANLGMISLIRVDSQLHTPVYFFLSHLSFSDLCYSSAVGPKMLVDLFTKTKSIPFVGYALQFFFFYMFVDIECLLLAVMVFVTHPIYFFLRYLTLSDLCYTSTVTPKLITDLLETKKSISYSVCMTQLFTMHFFGGIKVFILTGMAYDHFVAIHRLLHYAVIIRKHLCDLLIVASCAGGFLHTFGQVILAVFLPYCSPNEIDHYFCDVYPLLKLACMDTSKIGFLVIANSGLMGLVTFVVLVISYVVILYTLKSYCAESHCKALSTCSFHITVVVLFFTPLLFVYI
ncbi:Olfactory receptor 4P4 [Heterocephalus glaber]|uniref:Olfactory receptor 4P4 n=1 Tax=Heterocephalus glaber TaxID=10181 RepID=G5C3Z7_HETGA|nr:Olfactory receptor 4P4 [Heterocephalus glaber]